MGDNFPYVLEEDVVPKVTPSVVKMGITKIISASPICSEPTPNPSPSRGGETVDVVIEILTGRTHQIRYHLSQHGLPIVGDTLYGPDNIQNKDIEMQLTAWKLVFEDFDGEIIELLVN
jgi:hypothetical protein